FSVDGGSYSPVSDHPYVSWGTLAKPFALHGIPCAAGHFEISDIRSVTCPLAHDAVLFGIPLRGGAKIVANVSRYAKPSIRSGFLGQPCTYFGIDWPIGTKIEDAGSPGITAGILQGRQPGSVMFTLPEGATRTIAGRIVRAGIPIPFDDGKPDLSMLDIFLKN
ncbi:MAG TPA: hypothetical protein VF286_13310, partial [Acidiphilium sp.]